jgi:hypothetical protein
MDRKNKMQNVSFRSVEEFLEYLPAEERVLVEVLRKLILDTLPGIEERLSFNVPYYRMKKDICFIWPASILWGKKKTYEGVRLGFSYGHLLQDEIGYLNKGNRKQVSWRDFGDAKEIDRDLIRMYLYEAISIHS